jgi:hypothetical protein
MLMKGPKLPVNPRSHTVRIEPLDRWRACQATVAKVEGLAAAVDDRIAAARDVGHRWQETYRADPSRGEGTHER